jgi:hypothetical protein
LAFVSILLMHVLLLDLPTFASIHNKYLYCKLFWVVNAEAPNKQKVILLSLTVFVLRDFEASAFNLSIFNINSGSVNVK